MPTTDRMQTTLTYVAASPGRTPLQRISDHPRRPDRHAGSHRHAGEHHHQTAPQHEPHQILAACAERYANTELTRLLTDGV